MQHVQMELKLHTVFARRTGQEPAAKAQQVQDLVRAAVNELEGRLSARFDAQEAKLQSAAQTEQALRGEIAALEGRLAARAEAGEGRSAQYEARLAAHIEATSGKAAEHDARLGSHIEATANRIDAADKRAAEYEGRMASVNDIAMATNARLAGIDQTLKAHGCSIESLESAIAQTDDLVERVVEAFDSLERSVTEQNELRFVAGRN
jgi:chromosome segregation ATPase